MCRYIHPHPHTERAKETNLENMNLGPALSPHSLPTMWTPPRGAGSLVVLRCPEMVIRMKSGGRSWDCCIAMLPSQSNKLHSLQNKTKKKEKSTLLGVITGASVYRGSLGAALSVHQRRQQVVAQHQYDAPTSQAASLHNFLTYVAAIFSRAWRCANRSC